MKNLLGEVIVTSILFGIGKIIYNAGANNEKKKIHNAINNLAQGPLDKEIVKRLLNKIKESE